MNSSVAKWIVICGTILVVVAGILGAIGEHELTQRAQISNVSSSGPGMQLYSLPSLLIGAIMVVAGIVIAFRKSK